MKALHELTESDVELSLTLGAQFRLWRARQYVKLADRIVDFADWIADRAERMNRELTVRVKVL